MLKGDGAIHPVDGFVGETSAKDATWRSVSGGRRTPGTERAGVRRTRTTETESGEQNDQATRRLRRTPRQLAGTQTRVTTAPRLTGHNVGIPVMAEDPDPNILLTYTLSGADAASVQTSGNNGQIRWEPGRSWTTRPRRPTW